MPEPRDLDDLLGDDDWLDRLRDADRAAIGALGPYRLLEEVSRGGQGIVYRARDTRTDAEVALRQSEFNYAQAVYDYLVARAQLDEATGRVPLVDVGARAN